MNVLFNAIKARIFLKCPEITYVQMFNNQFDLIEDGKSYSFPMPCVFIEFVNNQELEQLGGGYQIYPELTVRVHVAHDYYNAPDGTQEQNLDVFPLKQRVYGALQKFEPAGAVQFIRVAEGQDYNHSNVYHFTQDYKTSYIDQQQAEPIGGVPSPYPLGLDTNVTYNPPPYMK